MGRKRMQQLPPATMRCASALGALVLLASLMGSPAGAEALRAAGLGEVKPLDAEQSARVAAKVLPKDGYTLPIKWGDVGVRLARLGVIDLEKFKRLYGKGPVPPDFRHLEEPSEAFVTVTADNAQFLVTVFWGLGLANKSPLLDKVLAERGTQGTMSLASTGGWTLGAKPAAELWSKFEIVRLTPEQQALVSDLAQRIYRPCCDNPTALPDCNHGIALLGLMELMAADGLGREEILEASLRVNSFWFPQHYVKTALLFAARQTDWDAVDPQEVLGRRYSSASGWRQHVDAELRKLAQALPPPGGGGTCALPASSSAAGDEMPPIHGLIVDRADPEILDVATHTGLLRVRQGDQFRPVGSGRVELTSFAADSRDGNTVYAGGRADIPPPSPGGDGLLVSRDGGRTWQPVALADRLDLRALAYSPGDGGQLFGWSVASPAGLYRIRVEIWRAERLPAQALSGVLSLAASPEKGGSLLAGTQSGLMMSGDGGLTWRPVAGLPADAAVTAVSYHATDAHLIYAYVARPGIGLMRSRDAGATWEAAGVVGDAQTALAAIVAGPGDHVAIASTHADVLRSRDGGRSWQWMARRGQAVAGRR
jgi:photosystem II stability/assembly factor-like uncharacterized protein